MISRLGDLKTLSMTDEEYEKYMNSSSNNPSDEKTPLKNSIKIENDEKEEDEKHIDVWSKRDKSTEIAISNFSEDVADLTKKMEQQEKNIDQLRKHHLSLMIASSGEKKKESSAEIDRETREITSLNQEISGILKTMKTLTDKKLEESGGKMTGEIRIREGQYIQLTRRFQTILNQFQKDQGKFKEKFTEKMVNAYKASNPDISDEEIRKLASENKLVSNKPKILKSQQGTIDALYDEAVETNKDIKSIEKSLIELQDMFISMANIVELQDDLINNLEENVVKAEAYIAKGVEDLVEGVKIQEKSGKLKKIMLIVVLVLALVIMLTLVGGSIPVILAAIGVFKTL